MLNFLLFFFLFIFNINCDKYINLTQRQLCDLGLIMNGGFSPLTEFMNQTDYNSVVKNMRLANGKLWPMPIVLDIEENFAKSLKMGETIALKDPENHTLATITVEEIWNPNKTEEAQNVYGTTNPEHPGVNYLFNQTKDYYISGKITKIKDHIYYDFMNNRKSPAELKAYFAKNNITKVVAFQTRNPMHRAHIELTTRAVELTGAHLLINPAVGMTMPGDIDHFTRTKCYQKALNYYNIDITLNLLPIAMRMAGPREAIWHALIRKNYGVTHFIVGRDHAGPGKDSAGVDFYGPYDAQKLVLKYAPEIGIEIVPFNEMVYIQELDKYFEEDKIPAGFTPLRISGTKFKELLNNGQDIPAWFSYPEIIAELRKVYPPKIKQGMVLFFTGLSGSGKSTIANALAISLREKQDRKTVILDGDIIRRNLSSELGFSRKDRSTNIRRVGFVANEISKLGGIAICPMIAPYKEDREFNREYMKQQNQNYIEIYISTPLDVCQKRDTKGLYSKNTSQLTGVNDPYEEPINPEITIDTSNISILETLQIINSYLFRKGYVEY